MRPSRSPGHTARLRSLTSQAARFVALAVLLALLSSGVAFAQPSTPEIEAKRQQAAAAQEELDQLAEELELRTEEYEQVAAALTETRAQLERTRVELEAARKELQMAEAHLADRAAEIYRSGGVQVVDVLLGVRSFRDFLTRVEFLQQVARGDASAVVSVKDATKRVELAESSLEARVQEQAILRERAAVKQAEMLESVERQKSYIAGLNSEIARLVRQEQERQARIAAERARQAALRAAQLQRAAAAASSRRFEPSSLGGGHPEIVKIALGFIGVPYVWGGSSPGSGFDCSGLTWYVYAQAGITIPRNSRSQFQVGAFIPPDRLDALRQGDLVFFGTDADPARIHHVGIYVGDGNFIHAPQTGQDVMVSSLGERIDKRGDYVGACRF